MTSSYDTFFAFQRDPQSSEEPSDLSLWMKTHMKNDQWSDDATKSVYVSKSQITM